MEHIVNILKEIPSVKDITDEVKGVFYVCKLEKDSISVTNAILFNDQHVALEAYANTRNPESQLVTGNSKEEIIKGLNVLHANMAKPEWIEMLHESI